MFKRLFLFLLSIIIPPIGIFFIIKSKGEGKNIIPAKILLTCILIFISSIFWMITYPKIHTAYENYRKPLTADTNEKHRQSIENLYNEYLEIVEYLKEKNDYGEEYLANDSENHKKFSEWRDKFNEVSPNSTKEEFSEVHAKAFDYFANLLFNTEFPNDDSERNVSDEKKDLIEQYFEAVINSNDDEAATLIQVIDSDSPTKKENSAPVKNIFSTDVTPSAVRNDVTGNWKKVLISEDIAIQEKALEYYNTYFDSKKEIHAIINFSNNTTTKISVLGNSLDVTIYEYVSKEEHDAKILFSGQLLAEYFVNMDTGEIEQIQ